MFEKYYGILLLYFLTFGSMMNSIAQYDIWSVDSLYKEAQTLINNEQGKKGRAVAYTLLNKQPRHHDARILIARSYVTDEKYKHAKQEIKKVLKRDKYHADALALLATMAMKKEDYDEALSYCDEGLKHAPTDNTLLLKKAAIYHEKEEPEKIPIILNEILTREPENEAAKRMLHKYKQENSPRKVGINQTYTAFNDVYKPRYLLGVFFSNDFNWGSLTTRLNYTRRFGRAGMQLEIDAYPSLRKGTYLYVNVGIGDVSVFPKYRTGLEIFQKLPQSFEASLGFRHLQFSSSNVTMLTSSVGKYYKDYWFSLRPFVKLSDEPSGSLNLTIRKYWTRQTFIGVRVGAGASPDNHTETNLQTLNVRSQKIGINSHYEVKPRLVLKSGIQYAREELPFRAGDFVVQYQLNFGISYNF